MATSSHTQGIDQTQISPGSAILAALVGRLRSHAKAIKNPEARRTMGRDMVAAADVIERALVDLSVQDAAAAAMVALLGRRGFAAYVGGGADVG